MTVFVSYERKFLRLFFVKLKQQKSDYYNMSQGICNHLYKTLYKQEKLTNMKPGIILFFLYTSEYVFEYLVPFVQCIGNFYKNRKCFKLRGNGSF